MTWTLGSELESCVFDVEQAVRHSERVKSTEHGGGGGEEKKEKKTTLESPQEFWEYKQKVTAAGGRAVTEAAEEEGELLLRKADEKLAESVEKLAVFVKQCDNVRDNINKGKTLLNDLESKHQTVSEKTSSLHETCKKLLEEQTRFEKIVTDIETPLTYLRELDRIGPLLGLPLQSRLSNTEENSEKTKTRAIHPDSPEFVGLLQRLDECIDFVEDHPEYKDYDEYSTKFQQLHLRGLSLLRNLVVDSLRATTTSARAGIETKYEQLQKMRMLNQQVDEARIAAFESEVHALLFMRFRAQAGQLRSYIYELENRVEQKDASDLLFSCHKSYCAMRSDLLKLTVPRAPELTLRNDILNTLRAACPYLLSVCRNEYKLFHEFFSHESVEYLRSGVTEVAVDDRHSSPSSRMFSRQASASSLGTALTALDQNILRDAFLDMMTDVCGVLYDLVRPLVVRLSDLQTLCEAVRTIEGDVIEGYAEVLGEAGKALHDTLIQILQDVQERLIFSTNRYISDNIAGFQPTSQDLRYPEILAEAQQEKNKDRRTGILAGCYKSLDNTLQCLIWIYRCVEPQTFEELAQEAVVSCALSLQQASQMIARRSRLDGDLFFIKHLLVLREQISPFNTQLTIKQVKLDFSTTAAAFGDFLAHSRNIFSRTNNAIVDLVAHGVPTIHEDEVDCKKDLETQLKQACESFIVRTYEQALASLIAFLQRASKPLQEENQVFQEQDFAQPPKVQAMLEQSLSSVPEFLNMIRGRMALYLSNAQTEAILFNPVKANIFAALTQMTNCIEANYSQDNAAPMLKTLASLRTAVSALERPLPETVTLSQNMPPPPEPQQVAPTTSSNAPPPAPASDSTQGQASS